MNVLLQFMGMVALFPYFIVGALIGFFFICIMIIALIRMWRGFKMWAKTGFCGHLWKLDRTNSYGQKHWYKCEKCSTERLR